LLGCVTRRRKRAVVKITDVATDERGSSRR
jgi:hypothetical protein